MRVLDAHPGAAVAQGVLDDRDEDLGGDAGIGVNLHGLVAVGHLEHHTALIGELGAGRGRGIGGVARSHGSLVRISLSLCRSHQRLHHLGHPVGVAENGLERFAHLLAVSILETELGLAAQGRERGSELVRDLR